MFDLTSVSNDALLQSTYQSLLDSQQYYSWRILELYYLLYFFQRAAAELRLTQLEEQNNRRFKVLYTGFKIRLISLGTSQDKRLNPTSN